VAFSGTLEAQVSGAATPLPSPVAGVPPSAVAADRGSAPAIFWLRGTWQASSGESPPVSCADPGQRLLFVHHHGISPGAAKFSTKCVSRAEDEDVEGAVGDAVAAARWDSSAPGEAVCEAPSSAGAGAHRADP
jgi:hypothetical protein